MTTTHLLDTDTCSYLLRGKTPRVAKRLVELGPARVSVSVITAIELRTGADISSARAKYRRLTDAFLRELVVLPVLSTDVKEIGRVRAELRRAGTPIGPLDALIAGQACARDLIVVTHNVREFSRVAGLTIEDWTLERG